MRFEYKIITINSVAKSLYESDLDKLGKEGWELCSVIVRDLSFSTSVEYYFKRAVKAPK